MRRKIAVVVGTVTLAAAAAFAAPAGAQPVGGCPSGDGWTLDVVGAALDYVDNGTWADQNGDGYACYRVNKGQTDVHDGSSSYTWKDNASPLPDV